VGSRAPVNWAARGRLIVSDLDDAAPRRLLHRTIHASPTGEVTLDIEALVRQVPGLTGRTHGCTNQPRITVKENPCQRGTVHTWHDAVVDTSARDVRSHPPEAA
jgi:hypothetical protein